MSAQIWAQRARDKDKQRKPEEIPQEYKRHWRVFDERLAQRFPPDRQEIMEIYLTSERSTDHQLVYLLNRKEMDILRKSWKLKK